MNVELMLEVQALYARYARAVDDARFDEWLTLFDAECGYHVIARENVQRGMQLPIVRCRTRDMLVDRIVSLQQANIYNIHTDRHMVSNVVVCGDEGDAIAAEADFVIFQTDVEGQSRLFAAGRYRTRLLRRDGRLLIREQTAILDTAAVPTLMATPI
ncbi:MAG: nuclear transport factor 2 family protein [Betaproteobacteria bacterium]